MNLFTRGRAAAGGCAATLAQALATLGAYPAKTIRIVAPFPPGRRV